MFKKIIKHLLRKAGIQSPIENPYKKLSFSQCGEDLIIKYIFNLRGIQHPSYLDIGANHPWFLNNTSIFYTNGSHGINIEANPELINAFNTERKNDINLNVGIGSESGEMDFYIMEDNTLSTFSKEEADYMVSTGKVLKEVKKIELTTIAFVLNKYCNNIFPDLLTLDAEGMDFQILKSIDYTKSIPKVICVEAAEYSSIGAGKRRDELIDFLSSKGYYEYANTNLNAIMVNKSFWFI